jgi:hypothetical protein
MKQDYYEKTTSRLIPVFIIQAILFLALMIPLVQAQPLLKVAIFFGLASSLIWLFRTLLFSRPVLIIEENEIYLRGLRPGCWKVLQFWQNERIRLNEIVKIRVGKIREDFIFDFKLPPRGVPSSNAARLKYLWITYERNGELNEIYYPHTPQIKNFGDALQKLKNLKDICVEEFPS